MKHLKTFESFQINEEEEIIGAIKKAYDDNKIAKYKKNLQAAIDKFTGPTAPRAWKERLNNPTEEILAKFWKDAEADKYASGKYDVEDGGSGGVGGPGVMPSNRAGDGGAGTASSYSGSAVTYAGGGGGANFNSGGSALQSVGGAYPALVGGSPGGGGTGGGFGTPAPSLEGTAGTVNTGGGGGSLAPLTNPYGGSGIVIIRYKYPYPD